MRVVGTPMEVNLFDEQRHLKGLSNFLHPKERHQNSGEILYLYNVKIEGGRGFENLVS